MFTLNNTIKKKQIVKRFVWTGIFSILVILSIFVGINFKSADTSHSDFIKPEISQKLSLSQIELSPNNDNITNIIRNKIETRAILQSSFAKSDIKNELYSEAYLYHHPLLTEKINQYCSNNVVHNVNEVANCNSASKMNNYLYYAYFSLSDPAFQSGLLIFIKFMCKLLLVLFLLYFIIEKGLSFYRWNLTKIERPQV